MQNYFTTYASLLEDYNLSRQGYKLALLLLKSANAKGESFKSKSTMAIECKCSVSTISRAISELKKKKIIDAIKRPDKRNNNNRQTSNYYTFLIKSEDSGIKYHVANECVSLSPCELKVYNHIAKRIGNRGSWGISRSEMVKALGFSSSTVFYAIKALEKKQLIVIENNNDKGYHESNTYSLVFTNKEEKEMLNPIIYYNDLSPNGQKLFDFIDRKNGIVDISNKNMAAQVKMSIPQLKQATRELKHYQMISLLYTYEDNLLPEDEQPIEFIIECFLKERIGVVPVLPIDVANGEPSLIDVEDTTFSVTALAPVSFKIYCYILWCNAHGIQTKDARLLLQQCKVSVNALNKALLAFGIAKLLDLTKDKQLVAIRKLLYADFASIEPFMLSPCSFKVYAYLWLMSGRKRKLYVEKNTIASECGISSSSVSRALRILKENKLIFAEPVFSDIYGRLGNIYTLVDKNDIGG